MTKNNSHYYDPFFNPYGEKFSLRDNLLGNVSNYPGTCYFPSTAIERQFQYQLQLEKNRQYIMLLTKMEVHTILDSWGAFGRTEAERQGEFRKNTLGYAETAATYGVSVKDTYSVTILISKLGGFGIKAITFVRNGTEYIKLTGYPAIRKILNGTVYRLDNMKVIEAGLGKYGVNKGIVQGTKLNIYAAAAFRVIEQILSDEADAANFIGGLATDIVKALVAGLLTKGGVALIGSVAALSAGWFVFAVVAIGIAATYIVTAIDSELGLTKKLQTALREYSNRVVKEDISGKLGLDSQLLYKKL
ncbi:hypothetical protein WDV76_08000 [Xenorhabdus griffiniae]|uniref:hypothetical protein n=1 Tax=Xenorhabdus griffiniae TaxID=351672 RepID=UPI0030D2A06B